MSLTEELKELGADTEDALKRFMNNGALYEKMLKKFPASASEQNVKESFDQQDFETAVARAHTLKGVTGNLSLTPLYLAYTNIVASLREGDKDKAMKILDMTLPVQERFVECISKYM